MPITGLPIAVVPVEGDAAFPANEAIIPLDSVGPSASNRQHQTGRTRDVILRDRVNKLIAAVNLIGTGVGLYLPLDGSGTMAGNLAMGNNRVTGLGAATAVSDAVRKDQTVLRDGSQAMTGPLAMGGQKITGLGAPTLGTDATTKTYVDTAISGAGSTYRKRKIIQLEGSRDGVGSGFQESTFTASAFAANEVRAQSTPPEELWIQIDYKYTSGSPLRRVELVKFYVDLTLNANTALSTFKLYGQQIYRYNMTTIADPDQSIPNMLQYVEMHPRSSGEQGFYLTTVLDPTVGSSDFTNESDTEVQLASLAGINDGQLYLTWLHATRQWRVKLRVDPTIDVFRFRLWAVSERYEAVP